MSDLTKVCPTSEIPEGSVKSFEVGTNVIAVYNVAGEFFATDNECTHGAASLFDRMLTSAPDHELARTRCSACNSAA